MGNPRDPDYWKKWRAAHPEYRERERLRSRARERTPEQRRAERERARLRAASEEEAKARRRAIQERSSKKWRQKNWDHYYATQRALQRKHQHKYYTYNADARRRKRFQRWIDDAHRITQMFIRPDNRSVLHDTLYEDAVSECLMVLVLYRRQKPEYREPRAIEAVRQFIRAERRHRWYASRDVDEMESYLGA